MKWNHAALAVIMVAFAFVQVAASDWEQRAASEECLALQQGDNGMAYTNCLFPPTPTPTPDPDAVTPTPAPAVELTPTPAPTSSSVRSGFRTRSLGRSSNNGDGSSDPPATPEPTAAPKSTVVGKSTVVPGPTVVAEPTVAPGPTVGAPTLVIIEPTPEPTPETSEQQQEPTCDSNAWYWFTSTSAFTISGYTYNGPWPGCNKSPRARSLEL